VKRARLNHLYHSLEEKRGKGGGEEKARAKKPAMDLINDINYISL